MSDLSHASTSPTAPAAASGAPGAGSAFTAPMRRILVVAGSGLAVLLPVGAVAGWLLGGSEVGLGILLGLAIPAVFFGITVATGLLAARLDNGPFIGAVMGTWFVKMVVLIVVMASIRDAEFFHRGAFFVALMVGVVGWLAAEVAIALRSRVPYVEPERTAVSGPLGENSSRGG